MTLPDRVSPEEAAQVFRRAAELETAGIRGDSAALLDADTLEAIGREVGLSPAAISMLRSPSSRAGTPRRRS